MHSNSHCSIIYQSHNMEAISIQRECGMHIYNRIFSSVQFSRSVVSDSLRPHELQHTRPPVHQQLPEFTQTHVHRVSDAIQPSDPLFPLLLLLPIPPSIRIFSNESTLPWGGQSIGVSASASVLPMNTQDWSPLGWTGWIPLQSKGLLLWKINILYDIIKMDLSLNICPIYSMYNTNNKP